MSKLICEFFDRISKIDAPIVTDITGDLSKSISGDDLVLYCDRLAALFSRLRINPGDQVVALFDNTIETAISILTAMRHGITLYVQSVDTSLDELVKLKQSLEARAIINATRKNLNGIYSIRLEDLHEFHPLLPKPIPPRTPFTVTFTSGSTGAPKGVVHPADSFLSCADTFNSQTKVTQKDIFLNVMPMYYMAGIFNGLIAPLAAGASVVISSAFNTASAINFWPIINREKINSIWLSPTMLALIMRLDRKKKAPSTLERLFIGTGALSVSDAIAFQQRYGLKPQQSYGLSELLYVSVDSVVKPTYGTVGYLLEGVEIELNKRKAISISSRYSFLGYLIDNVFHPHDGPFHTSDLGELSDNGKLTVLGRSDDIIVRGGVNVNPAAIEAALTSIMSNKRFCIIGIQDKILGQKVVLVTEGQALDTDTFAEAQRIVRSSLSNINIDVAHVVQQLPVGPTGKIRRTELIVQIEGKGL